jgi:1-acyl-sn-glycerol-3-phosphate acyltransferase
MMQGASSENLPYSDPEVSAVLKGLITDKTLQDLVGAWTHPTLMALLPPVVRALVRRSLRKRLAMVHSIAGFQAVVRDYVEQLVASTLDELTISGLDDLDPSQGYLFLSNHRDIACDSMFLNLLRHRAQLKTVFIAVGDNLIQQRFATDLMRLNKSFFINRTGENPRSVYKDLVMSSTFIQSRIDQGDSIWLAQSEGRAKNAIDETDASVLKMLQLSDRKMPLADKIRALNIVPMCLSYEFDPLDVEKARELRAIEETGSYQKAPGEDLKNMAIGMSGYKGRVQLSLGQPLLDEFEDLAAVAAEVDRQILAGTQLFPINHWAVSVLHPGFSHPLHENVADLEQIAYFKQRLSRCEAEAQPFWLSIYANPAPRVFNTNSP